MTGKQKAAGRGNGQAAFKPSSTRDLSTRKRAVSIFIQVDAHYAIGADSHSWHILQRRRYKGAERWEPILWYPTLEQCMHGLWQRSVKTCGAQSLAELLAESQRVISAISRALRPSFKVEVGCDA